MKKTRRYGFALAALLALTGCSRAPENNFQDGLAFYKQQNYAKAAACFEKAIANAPATPQALTFLGVCELHQGRTASAYRHLQDALKLDPNYLPARYNLALAQLEAGQTEAAATALRQISQQPGAPADLHLHLATAYNNLAVTAARQRDTKRADQYFQLAAAADPNSVAAKNLAALHPPATPPKPTVPVAVAAPAAPVKVATPTPTQVVQVAKPPTQPAATQVTTPPAPLPQPPSTKRRAAIAPRPLKAGNRAQAKTFFNDAVKAQQEGRLTGAIALYSKAIATDPTFAQAYYNLAIAYRDSRQFDRAFENYELALLADPSFNNARYNYAILLQDQGYTADALDQYEKILQNNPNEAAVHLAAATLYTRDPATRANARQHYETYLRLMPSSPLARDIRAWLDQNR